jgi:hypothetical protein
VSETSAEVCKNCGRPIRLFYGTWIHQRTENAAFAGAPFCDEGLAKAEPYEGDA